jgi:hypothetical protein
MIGRIYLTNIGISGLFAPLARSKLASGGPYTTMDLNEWLPIRDFSTDTLFIVAQRLELSTTRRHGIAREAELDDLWRYVQAALEDARRAEPESAQVHALERLFQAVTEAHDLTGAGQRFEAAARLRQALVKGIVEPNDVRPT